MLPHVSTNAAICSWLAITDPPTWERKTRTGNSLAARPRGATGISLAVHIAKGHPVSKKPRLAVGHRVRRLRSRLMAGTVVRIVRDDPQLAVQSRNRARIEFEASIDEP